MAVNPQALMDFAQSLLGAKVYFRTDWECYYFDLDGKMFGIMSDDLIDNPFMNLKNDPEKNEILRTLYPNTILPGWHMNKVHWNSIYLNRDNISFEECCQLIEESHHLVFNKLTKKKQKEIIGEQGAEE